MFSAEQVAPVLEYVVASADLTDANATIAAETATRNNLDFMTALSPALLSFPCCVRVIRSRLGRRQRVGARREVEFRQRGQPGSWSAQIADRPGRLYRQFPGRSDSKVPMRRHRHKHYSYRSCP